MPEHFRKEKQFVEAEEMRIKHEIEYVKKKSEKKNYRMIYIM